MKLLISLLFIIIFSNTNAQKTYNGYDSDLARIVSGFKENIKNKSKCKELKSEAYYLSNDIEKSIDGDELDLKETEQLEALLKETEAVEEFIGTISNAGNNMFVDMNKVFLANQRINASIAKVSSYNFCVDIYQVTLNGYRATLAYNSSSTSYTVSYKWKAPNGSASGSGTMGLPSNSMRHIIDNRDTKNYKTIKISNIICKDISSY